MAERLVTVNPTAGNLAGMAPTRARPGECAAYRHLCLVPHPEELGQAIDVLAVDWRGAAVQVAREHGLAVKSVVDPLPELVVPRLGVWAAEGKSLTAVDG